MSLVERLHWKDSYFPLEDGGGGEGGEEGLRIHSLYRIHLPQNLRSCGHCVLALSRNDLCQGEFVIPVSLDDVSCGTVAVLNTSIDLHTSTCMDTL